MTPSRPQGKGASQKHSAPLPHGPPSQSQQRSQRPAGQNFAAPAANSQPKVGRTGGLTMFQQSRRPAEAAVPPPPVAAHVIASGKPLPENITYNFKPAPHRLESLQGRSGPPLQHQRSGRRLRGQSGLTHSRPTPRSQVEGLARSLTPVGCALRQVWMATTTGKLAPEGRNRGGGYSRLRGVGKFREHFPARLASQTHQR